ncbi:GHKL domain-containing protein [uncultured Clostridium sp.]|uniref:sensor histidine kinase n=1 Tax=uncultured Clostridium sp. TaxID=59620 RepID=UPI003217EE00
MSINNFLELFTLGMICNILFNKINVKNILVSIVLAYVFGIIIEIPVVITIGALTIIYALINKFLYNDTFYKALIKITISLLVLMIAESIVGIIVGILNINPDSMNLTIVLLGVFSITLIFVYYFTKYIKVNVSTIPKLNTKIIIVGIVNLFLILTILIFINDSHFIGNGLRIGLFSALLVFIIITMILCKDIYKIMKENEILEIQNKYNLILNEYIEKLRASEHEYKNHLNVIYSTLQVGDYSEVNKVIKKYIEDITYKDTLTKLMTIDNIILRALIYSKICEAEKADVNIRYNINNSLNDIKISQSDMVIILTNLLNNAIESAKESSSKSVEIYIDEDYSTNGKYIITIKNTVKDMNEINISSMFKEGYSTKSSGRGYGLHNVQKIVSSNKGNILIDTDNDMLSVEIHI